MFMKKTGYPEDSELVMCTVTKIHYHSVFVNLDEYGKSGMIHISEISPGRIRNIHDYVKEGKVVVCKVLRINEERGHIDLSLRRVSDGQRREKVNSIKQEQMVEKIIEQVAKSNGTAAAALYKDIRKRLKLEQNDLIYPYFEEVVIDDVKLVDKGIPDKIAKDLEELIRQRIKPPRVEISGELRIISYAADGVDIVKATLQKMDAVEGVDISYSGGGKYKVIVTSDDYKQAEKFLKEAISTGEKLSEKNDAQVSFRRIEK